MSHHIDEVESSHVSASTDTGEQEGALRPPVPTPRSHVSEAYEEIGPSTNTVNPPPVPPIGNRPKLSDRDLGRTSLAYEEIGSVSTNTVKLSPPPVPPIGDRPILTDSDLGRTSLKQRTPKQWIPRSLAAGSKSSRTQPAIPQKSLTIRNYENADPPHLTEQEKTLTLNDLSRKWKLEAQARQQQLQQLRPDTVSGPASNQYVDMETKPSGGCTYVDMDLTSGSKSVNPKQEITKALTRTSVRPNSERATSYSSSDSEPEEDNEIDEPPKQSTAYTIRRIKADGPVPVHYLVEDLTSNKTVPDKQICQTKNPQICQTKNKTLADEIANRKWTFGSYKGAFLEDTDVEMTHMTHKDIKAKASDYIRLLDNNLKLGENGQFVMPQVKALGLGRNVEIALDRLKLLQLPPFEGPDLKPDDNPGAAFHLWKKEIEAHPGAAFHLWKKEIEAKSVRVIMTEVDGPTALRNGFIIAKSNDGKYNINIGTVKKPKILKTNDDEMLEILTGDTFYYDPKKWKECKADVDHYNTRKTIRFVGDTKLFSPEHALSFKKMIDDDGWTFEKRSVRDLLAEFKKNVF
eukprot:GHVO01032600.1.p1 GENE.GHVO01032600.1~~GHVO01032600.1.p1  ORF type:complete len:574 (+),score=71.63 GHVO01032600.1:227-1948(+)